MIGWFWFLQFDESPVVREEPVSFHLHVGAAEKTLLTNEKFNDVKLRLRLVTWGHGAIQAS